MGLFTLAKFEKNCDVIVKRDGRLFNLVICRYGDAGDNTIVRNAWPDSRPKEYFLLTRRQVRWHLIEAMEHGVKVPKYLFEYFDFQHAPGRIYWFLKTLFR